MIGLYDQEFFLGGLLFMDCFTIRPGKSKTIKSRNIFKYDFTKKNPVAEKKVEVVKEDIIVENYVIGNSEPWSIKSY